MMTNETKRERTYQWEDPMKGAQEGLKMRGLDYLESMKAGQLPRPPLMETLDFEIGEIKEGEVTFSFMPQEFHYNPIGTVHGGVISTILDSVMGCALHSLLPQGVGYTTVELKVNFIRSVTIRSGRMSATGRVIHQGKRAALTETRLVDERGTLYAHATSTCLLIPLPQ